MKKQIILEMEESIIAEFAELPAFWYGNEEGKFIKPTIQETLKKYVIGSINERRIELVTSQAAMNTDILKESDITIKEVKRL